MKRLLVLCMVVLLAVVPPVFAQREPGYWVMANGYWDDPCDGGIPGGGIVAVDIDIYYTSDDVALGHIEMNDPVLGHLEGDWTNPGHAVLALSDVWWWGVPAGADMHEWRDVVTDSGDVIAKMEIFASCVTGEISIWVSNIFDTLEPDPSERVLGTVLYDTPVYSAPDPASALADVVLTAGQTWFVVGSETGTDGALWYEVFVGGAHNGFVPAAALELQGPLP